MKPLVVNIDHEDFLLTFKNEGSKEYNMRWSGQAIAIYKFDDGSWMFQSNVSSDFVEDIKDARVWFEWSFCWRGVWEGRVYFKDDEYWSSEMKTIPLIWNHIESIVKNKIKSDNPDYGSFDD